MTFSVSLNLYRLFLTTCRWILVKMSLNCKYSSSSGNFSSILNPKKGKEPLHGSNRVLKWRSLLLFLLLLGAVIVWFIWFFSGLNDGSLKDETLNLCGKRTRVLLEHFNVSKEQFHDLAPVFYGSEQMFLQCTRNLGYEMLLTNVACAMKFMCSENQELGNQPSIVSETVQFRNQCPVRDENVPSGPALYMAEDKPLVFASHSMSTISPGDQNCEKYVLQGRTLGVRAKEPQIVSLCLVKACGWIFFGVVLSFQMSWLRKKLLENKKWELFQQQLSQQKQQHQSQSSSKSFRDWRFYVVIVLFIGGVSLSILLFGYSRHEAFKKRNDVLVNLCVQRARMLQDQFNMSMNHVHALSILVSTFHHGKQPSAIDQKTFGQYTQRTSFERPLTSGVSYALRVLHKDREQFENQHGWRIKKMETEDQSLIQDCDPENLEPSPPQDEYAPVIFSQETVSHIVSIDMMSGKEDRENILRARASGKGVLTTPFNLLKSNHLGVVLTFAVYNTNLPPNVTPEERINTTIGYLGASYDIPSLVDKLLHQLASEPMLVVHVYDTTNKNEPIKMYGPDDIIDTGLLHISNLDFGDPARKHEMQCRFKQKAPLPLIAIMASGGSFVITMLLVYIFNNARNRIAKVERDCWEMKELKHRAEAADVAKSQFLATVSHEIRTPMNGVLGMLQMLMDTDLDANQLDFAETAHASGKDLISLINEVLDQAKIESGRLELETVPFDLRAVLDKVLSVFSGKSHEKGIELAVYVSDQIPAILVGDPGRCQQIITNLVGNSIKFTKDKGHIFVSVHLADEVRPPLEFRDEVLKHSLTLFHNGPESSYDTLSGFPVVDRWKSWKNFKTFSTCGDLLEESESFKLLVTVEDTGVGIPLDAQNRIFTPFMQADSSTSRTYGGTGIGLSISKRLVDLMGGEIGFVSECGTGSTFSFTLVLKKRETSSLDTKQQDYDPAVSEFRGIRALVVDKGIRAEVTRYHLQRLGIIVDIAFNLESACTYLSNNDSNSSVSSHFSMVLVDKDVWGLDSSHPFHRLLKELRQNGRTEVPETLPKVLLLATSITPTERNDLKSSGIVDNVLMKPLRLSVIIFCFREVLGKKRQLNRGKSQTLGVLRNKRILVVDDNLVNRRVAEGALKKYGAIVTCVDSGKTALEMLKPPHNFDACFMDLQMPEMDGFDATRKIRNLERKVNERIESGEASIDMFSNVAFWHTPILAMTADVIQANNEECMKCGMDDYVSKPFEEEQLHSALARFLV